MPHYIRIQDVLYSVADVPGDGNCFFHCLSLALHNNLTATAMLRNVVCQNVYNDWSNQKKHVLTCHGPHFTKDLYKIGMIEGNWWAAACEIDMASKILSSEIIVFLKHNETFTKITHSPVETKINSVTVLLEKNHFQLLTKVVPSHSSSMQSHQSDLNQNSCNQASKRTSNCESIKTPKHIKLEHAYISQCNKHSQTEQQEKTKPRRMSSYCKNNEEMISICKKLGIWVHSNSENLKKDLIKAKRVIKSKCKTLNIEVDQIPEAPPSTMNEKFDRAMTAIRAFELHQMSYNIYFCKTCHERRLNMEIQNDVCKRCRLDKDDVKMFSNENNMNPQTLPDQLANLTIIEQQLICRISPCIQVHMLKHGGIASSGHCVTFPQNINEPAQIFPRLPTEINVIKVRKQGKNDTSKEFRVRRKTIEEALHWLKTNNTAYRDIIISSERLKTLPEDGEILTIPTAEYKADHTKHLNDLGPAPEQFNIKNINGETASSVLLPDPGVNIQSEIEEIVKDVTGQNDAHVTVNKRGVFTIPWPTRNNTPLSEFTTEHFFTLAFPCLFPYGTGDFHVNRKRTCKSMADWAEHLLWYEDGRFAEHQYFKFVVHNMIMRKSAIDKSCFIIRQQLGDSHISIQQLREAMQSGDNALTKKILRLSATLRGTSQYWAQRGTELRALSRYKICKGQGLPSFFTTGSCAEYHFKPLKRLLKLYAKCTADIDLDLEDTSVLFNTLQKYTHIVAHYFDLRTQSYFKEVMGPVFGIDTYWYRQEFAKSRGMIHWHGLCWRSDREPHNLLYEALQAGLSQDDCALKLEHWAKVNFGMTANHPAGKDSSGNSIKSLWPPPEGTAPPPPEEKNPLVKLLMDVSESQESILEDYLLLTNRFNMHRCSDYCLTIKRGNKMVCRMEYGNTENPGKPMRSSPALVKDKNGSLRLEMSRDHQNLVQHSRVHTQGWRANGDISIILSKSNPENPSVDEINCTERYITGYACKGNQPTGAISDLFSDMVNCSKESDSAKSLCNKLLISTVKRDISAVEASFELSRLPLYRCSHTFQSVSLSGIRILEKGDVNISKRNALDKYINRDSNDRSSFYKFICKNNKVPVFSGCTTNASWPLQEEYCKSTLIIHWPNWRSLADIKSENYTWTEKMADFLKTDECPNFVIAEIERAKRKADEQSKQEEDEEMIYSSQQPEWMDIVKPVPDFEIPENDDDFSYDDGGEEYDWCKTSLNYPNDLGAKWIENLYIHLTSNDDALQIPDVDITQMNCDQRFAFCIVMDCILTLLNNKSSFQPLRLIVTGTAGSGKSFLINCLVKATRQLFQTNTCVQVICPTGNSANLISGVTLHSFLKVPTSYKCREMSPPEGTAGEQLQKNCDGLHMLLVDERSLIGASTLGWMEFNARYGMNKGQNCSQSWGGLPVVVFFGDDVQLPPVMDSPVYDCKMQSPAALHGALIWQEFSAAVTLHKSIRQNEEELQFKAVLTSVRNYTVSPEQAKWLQSFQWNSVRMRYGNDVANKIIQMGVHVFPTHNEVWNHNKQRVLDSNKRYPIAKITALFKGVHASTVTRDKSNGLLHTIYLCNTSKVMLTCNLCVPYGLFNGATGEVKDIIYSISKKPSNSLPKAVMVEFQCYNGPPFIESHPKLVPIHPIERSVDCFCHSCKRRQIPLKLGWATTIHKCQGMTIGKNQPYRYIVINPGASAFESRNPGALFVALSRAKTAGNEFTEPDFIWHPSLLLNEDRLCHKVKTNRVMARDRELARIAELSIATKEVYSKLSHLSAFESINEDIELFTES